MQTLVIATRNQHKVEEIRAVLGDGFHYLTLADLPGAPEVSEDASTFDGNARKKALALAAWLAALGGPENRAGWWVLADDSGLEVDALDGAPGVHSARFAALDAGHAGNSTDAENNAKLLRLLEGVPREKRRARFRCTLALALVTTAGKSVHTFQGACEGRILESPRGAGGFGYDPLFEPDGFAETFAQMRPAIKNRISHRGCALAVARAGWIPSDP